MYIGTSDEFCRGRRLDREVAKGWPGLARANLKET
jgi:hypothetical protein